VLRKIAHFFQSFFSNFLEEDFQLCESKMPRAFSILAASAQVRPPACAAIFFCGLYIANLRRLLKPRIFLRFTA
jgi:hypothetical protein